MGAKIIRFCPVTGARRDNGEWVIETPKGEIRCEYVVNAGGYRAAEVGKLFGRTVPMMVMSHQYMLFEEIPELAAWTKEVGHKLPLLRDVDTSYYLRQEKTGMNLGPYERNCRAHWATHNDPMPEDFSFQLFPDDLERLEWYLNDAIARVPILGTAGLSKVINGPIPYAPDGNPLIGPMPGVPNAFEACVFTFGIAQAGGAGKVLAEWVTEGQTEWDMWSCDPRRFTAFAAEPDYAVAKGMEIYGNEYAINFPRHAWPAARNRKLSPVHDRIAALGAQFNAYNGWERATWYAKPGDDISEESTLTFRRDGPWEKRVREECLAVRDAAGILDLPGFSRFRLYGPGARAWLSTMITGVVPKPGRIGLGYFADDKGRIVTEMSIVAIEEDRFVLITAAVAQLHDFEWLQKHLPQDYGFDFSKMRPRSLTCQILAGPKSRAILAEVCGADLVAAVAVASVDRDRRKLVPARPRVLRRRARLGDPQQRPRYPRDLRRGVGRRPEARAETVRHVRAGFAAAGERLPRLEAGPVDRLHGAAGRARALRQMGQAGLQGQGGAAEREAAGREEALRDAGRRRRRVRCALHVDALA